MNDYEKQQKISTFLVLLITIIIVVMVSTGCSTTVPVKMSFPEPPASFASQKCPDLQKIKEGPNLSDVTKTVTGNYNTYYECAVRHDAWLEWYNVNKKIFENIK